MSILSLENKLDKPKIDKSTFDLTHNHATAGKLGELIPIMVEEVLPNDEVNLKINHIIRMLPLAGVIQSRVDIFIHAFFVPNRISVGSDWEDIITGRTTDSVPVDDLASVAIPEGSIGDYMGLPIAGTRSNSLEVSRIPLLAYFKIYNDYYRNKIVQGELSSYNYSDNPIHRNWRRDYFTSALPYPQLGNPAAVTVNLSYLEPATGYLHGGVAPGAGNPILGADKKFKDSNGIEIIIDNIDDATIPVNEIKYAYAYQDWLTRMLKAGDDYSDHLLYVFGVNSSDARLQKPEYLGGYQAPIVVNDVTQMEPVYDSLDEIISPAGTQAGAAHSFGNSDYIDYFVEEHGYIVVIASILPKTAYYGGIPRHFSKLTSLDFYFPQFAYLPEQEIKNKELFVKDNTTIDEATFGYIERYAEYKHRNDRISCAMAKNFAYLNFVNIPTDTPTLNSAFLTCTPRETPFAVQNTIHFYGQFGFELKMKRPMPFNVDDFNLN